MNQDYLIDRLGEYLRFNEKVKLILEHCLENSELYSLDNIPYDNLIFKDNEFNVSINLTGNLNLNIKSNKCTLNT
jgi:hypothetical protein